LNLSPYELALITGGFTIVGSLAGALTAYFLGKDISRRNDFNKAAKEFITAFQEELARLKLEQTFTYDIIKPVLAKQMAAYYTFRGHLDGDDLEGITDAWQIYLVSTPPCPQNERNDKYEEERTALIERIEKLLKFAKFK
jgi:hypothetical protein